MINQPKNNCETCWFNWFNSHAKLIEVADEFYRAHGKKPMIALRGEKFVKNFLRFMATVHHFMQLEKEQNVASHQEESGNTGAVLAEVETRSSPDASPTLLVEGGETEGGSGSDERNEQGRG
jgi:hypothetical protein